MKAVFIVFESDREKVVVQRKTVGSSEEMLKNVSRLINYFQDLGYEFVKVMGARHAGVEKEVAAECLELDEEDSEETIHAKGGG